MMHLPLPDVSRRNFLFAATATATSAVFPSILLAGEKAPKAIKDILSSGDDADRILRALMPAIIKVLDTDRCFIYMRDPRKRLTAYTHGHTALKGWRHFGGGGWGPEPDPDALGEPMLKKAFSDPNALFIEDVETAPAHVLNKSLEKGYFGHRALVHAPLHHDGHFYGILETAVRDTPRVWTVQDQAIIRWLQPKVAMLAAEYLGHRP